MLPAVKKPIPAALKRERESREDTAYAWKPALPTAIRTAFAVMLIFDGKKKPMISIRTDILTPVCLFFTLSAEAEKRACPPIATILYRIIRNVSFAGLAWSDMLPRSMEAQAQSAIALMKA